MDIAWPAFLHLTGDAELQVVHDRNMWEQDPHLHAAHYLPTDVLIDSAGNRYALKRLSGKQVTLETTGQAATLQEVIHLIRAHEEQQGSCCVAKFLAPSIRDAIAALDSRHCMR